MVNNRPPVVFMAASSGTGSAPIPAKAEITVPEILEKVGTFVNAVAENYGIDDETAKFSGIKFPLLGLNHALVRAGFQSLERQVKGQIDMKAAIKASMTTDMSYEKPDQFYGGVDQHFTDEGIAALKEAIDVAHKISSAEGDGEQVQLSQHEVHTLLHSLSDLQLAMQRAAEGVVNDERAEPLLNLARDFETLTQHYADFAQRHYQVALEAGTSHDPGQGNDGGPTGVGN